MSYVYRKYQVLSCFVDLVKMIANTSGFYIRKYTVDFGYIIYNKYILLHYSRGPTQYVCVFTKGSD